MGYSGIFLYTIMTLYPPEQLVKLGVFLQPFLKHCMSSASPECRSLGRKSFLVWQLIDNGHAD